MKNSSKIVAMFVMTAAMGSASVMAAETGDKTSQDGPRMGWHKMTPEKMREHMAKRQAALHDKLKLTASQEPAWKTFVAATTPTGMEKGWGDRADMGQLSAPERMEKRIAMTKERETRMSAHLAALKTFYAVLTPEQQKVFNQETRHGGKHRGPQGDEARAKG